jgi:hypothetical protein
LANGSVMGQSWTLTGTAVDPPPISYDWDLDILIPPLNPRKVIASVEFNISGNTLLSFGVTQVRDVITDAVISMSVYADARVLDGPNKGNWNWSTSSLATPNGNMAVASSGFSPDEGGVGNFNVSVVPEPASIGLLAMGVVALVGIHVRQRRKRGC